eukprot:1978806-Pyramimonas_sp.AAC.1
MAALSTTPSWQGGGVGMRVAWQRRTRAQHCCEGSRRHIHIHVADLRVTGARGTEVDVRGTEVDVRGTEVDVRGTNVDVRRTGLRW